MRYFTVTSQFLSPKNNLARDIQALFSGADRVILGSEASKEYFLNTMKKAVWALNAKHPRCNPIAFETYSFHHVKGMLNVSARGVATLVIYSELKWKGGGDE